ncbi:MAG: DEAD/DEAH box helicase [Hyphomicrobium sp.]
METTTFADLGLSPKVQDAITAAGYSTPTPIQAAAIPVAVTGRDILGIAQTGTGKTASFVLPMITRLETGRARARMPRSLILAPTRELAAQVAQSFEKYGVNHKLTVALLIGGVSMDDQVKKLDRGVDVLIATPGRLLDHFQRGRVMMMGVEILVIDEADRMLDMGFIPDIEKICKLLPPRKQTLFFSATMPPEITRLVNTFLKDPVRIEVAKPATAAKTITQRFHFCADGEDWAKREMLRELVKSENVKNAIIFCNRKRDVAVLYKSLSKHGFNAGELHGDMDQKSRMATLEKFRNGEVLLLAASDVAARGLDIPDVSHVFNFDLPWAADDYVHRIGRTGRAGKQGHSISIVAPDDLKFVKDIEKITGEAAVWVGETPTEEDFAGAGKRRRGRGAPTGRGAPDRGRHGADRGSDRGAERRDARPPRGDRGPRPERTQWPKPSDTPTVGAQSDAAATPRADDRGERRPSRGRPERRDRASRPDRPGLGDQPSIAADAPKPARHREDRQPRSDQPKRADTDPRNDRPQRERAPRHDAWTDGPKPGPRQGGDRPRQPESKAPAHDPRGGGDRLGFAENMPAFMRKAPRPLKQPGRG